MNKWIVFKAESDEGVPHWSERKMHHSQALTWILRENWDSSNRPIPEPGDRFIDFVRVDTDHDPNKHAHNTHYRDSDWEVSRVEEYVPDLPTGTEFDIIVICYCKYSPIDAPLKPMPDRIISADSFGGDETKYQEYLNSQKVSMRV
jgi:hypothetical protein